jgi:uncharacterized membrane protein YgcG
MLIREPGDLPYRFKAGDMPIATRTWLASFVFFLRASTSRRRHFVFQENRMKVKRILAILGCLIMLMSIMTGCGHKKTDPDPETDPGTAGQQETADDPVPAGPSEEEMAKLTDISVEGAESVAADKLQDGTYDISVSAGSEQFRILESKLVVVGNVMQLVLKVEGDVYSRMYEGDSEEAASDSAFSRGEKDSDGNTSFRLNIKALNEVLTCSAYADEYGRWFDRTLFADASSLDKTAFKPEEPEKTEPKPSSGGQSSGGSGNGSGSGSSGSGSAEEPPAGEESQEPEQTTEPEEEEDDGLADGTYSVRVTWSGGTGRVSIYSPATLYVSNGRMTARIQWSSENYDYMIVNGSKIYPDSTAGGSVFTIPVPYLGQSFRVIGDTTAMSVPHEIEYMLRFDLN